MIEGSSYIEISRSAYQNNVDYILSLLQNKSRFYSVVKGNAYGHGMESFIPMAVECGVRSYCVFSQDEAYRLYQTLPDHNLSIIIMGYVDHQGIAWCIERGIEFYVFDMDRLTRVAKLAEKMKRPALIHLELETGMNRTGFKSGEVNLLMNFITSQNTNIRVKGIATHFAGAESLSNHFRIQKQIRKFERLSKKINSLLEVKAALHTSCSAAVLRFPNTHYDQVRVGILQYGFWPSREVFIENKIRRKFETDPLKRVISWKSRVMDISIVEEGEYVGYGNTFLTQYRTTLALIPVGYSLGYSRALSNIGHVLIRGKRARVIGLVNMNMMTVDITNIDGVENGDEVVIIGRQGEDEISVASFSELTDQVNYELLTRLPSNIKRKIIE